MASIPNVRGKKAKTKQSRKESGGRVKALDGRLPAQSNRYSKETQKKTTL